MRTIDKSRALNAIRNRTKREGECLVYLTQSRRPYLSVDKSRKIYPLARIIVAIREGLDLDDSSWWACHHCDNELCVRPSHLYKGTGLTNTLDAKERTGRNQGTKNGMNKLTQQQVKDIRSSCRTQREIAERYGISQSAVSLIKNRRRWH